MTRARCVAMAALLTPLVASNLVAQGHPHPGPAPERLGSVHFATSCHPSVASGFDRGVALLHSFEFGASIRAFEQVLAADSTCAMAWWGIALSRWTNPMVPNTRPPALLESGRRAAETATQLGTRATERERGYIAAVGELYDPTHRDQRTRVLAYAQAMEALSARHPDDIEARIFHALALVGSALPADKSYANQLRAGGIPEGLFASYPEHPGLAHYIIHSYDVPALASRAETAARRYADIAPSAAHALHMPSHTFTRVGLWRESIRTNQRSMEEATRTGSTAEALHAADYTMYASLQLRRDSAAYTILRALPSLAARFDPRAVTGAAPGSAGVFALAAIPARYALEREAWAEAAALVPTPSSFPYAEALTHFARALGAAHLGDSVRGWGAVDSLVAIRGRLLAGGEPYWGEQVAIQHLGASAWLTFAAGRREAALEMMREAAAREDATEKAAVTPGPLAPARELLAAMLLDLGRSAEALAEYRRALAREPNRYRSLSGAARAAERAGDRAAADGFARELAALTSP